MIKIQTNYFEQIFTIHNSSCGKVMFLHLSVILLGDVCLLVWGCTSLLSRHPLGRQSLGRHPPYPGRQPPGQTPLGPLHGHCSVTYWNAFLSLFYIYLENSED